MITLLDIEQTLNTVFNPISLVVTNQSEDHKHHGGWREGHITHISVFVVSEVFINQSKVKRHQLVYNALAGFLKNGLHAISITTLASTEV